MRPAPGKENQRFPCREGEARGVTVWTHGGPQNAGGHAGGPPRTRLGWRLVLPRAGSRPCPAVPAVPAVPPSSLSPTVPAVPHGPRRPPRSSRSINARPLLALEAPAPRMACDRCVPSLPPVDGHRRSGPGRRKPLCPGRRLRPARLCSQLPAPSLPRSRLTVATGRSPTRCDSRKYGPRLGTSQGTTAASSVTGADGRRHDGTGRWFPSSFP